MSDATQVLNPGTVDEQVVLNLLTLLRDQARRMNDQTVAFYNFLKARADDNRSRGLPATDPPQLTLKFVNEGWVRQAEQGLLPPGSPDETFIEVPYLPPPPAIAIAKPLVGGADPFLPGYFNEGPGDNVSFKEGYETHQNGVKYRKVVIGHNPLDADGNIYRWIPVAEQTQ